MGDEYAELCNETADMLDAKDERIEKMLDALETACAERDAALAELAEAWNAVGRGPGEDDYGRVETLAQAIRAGGPGLTDHANADAGDFTTTCDAHAQRIAGPREGYDKRAECRTLKAELARMRPVFDAAVAWRKLQQHWDGSPDMSDRIDVARHVLRAAVDAAEALDPPLCPTCNNRRTVGTGMRVGGYNHGMGMPTGVRELTKPCPDCAEAGK